MWVRRMLAALALVAALSAAATAGDQAPLEYRFSVPNPASHQLRVELTLADLPPGPLALHVSRSSPGRYAIHDFISRVSDLRVTAGGRALAVTGPSANGWVVPIHPSSVRVSYTVTGDRVDGTYLAVDASHAHINMPAALVWVPGLESRPARLTFATPPGLTWQVASQLLPTAAPATFTAPNLQYLMDSPVEWSAFTTRQFTVGDGTRTATFRLALHHAGSAADADAYARDVDAIVGEAVGVFGALPAFEAPAYTFLADFLPAIGSDGMEHRNSTVLTSPQSIASARLSLAEKASHEVFHAWNIERIRPRSLEPFDFDRENVSGELWLGEGVTNYYGKLLLVRAGLARLDDVLGGLASSIERVTTGEGRPLRSLVEMSRLAPKMDGAAPEVRAPYEATFISYYTWGETVGLALDLALRARDPRLSLDVVMQRLWTEFGSAPGEPGLVAKPYTDADVERVIGGVAGDATFAKAFMDRYVRGHDVPDFAELLKPAGYVLSVETGATGQSRMVITSMEKTGPLSSAQKAFRERWAAARRTRG